MFEANVQYFLHNVKNIVHFVKNILRLLICERKIIWN